LSIRLYERTFDRITRSTRASSTSNTPFCVFASSPSRANDGRERRTTHVRVSSLASGRNPTDLNAKNRRKAQYLRTARRSRHKTNRRKSCVPHMDACTLKRVHFGRRNRVNTSVSNTIILLRTGAPIHSLFELARQASQLFRKRVVVIIYIYNCYSAHRVN